MRVFSLLPILCLLVLFSLPADARNILTEQTEASDAREANYHAQTNLKNIQTKIEQKKQLIAREQQELSQLEAEEKRARADLEKSKITLDAKTKALEKAWGQRE